MKSKIHDTSVSEQEKQYRLKTASMSKNIVFLLILISGYSFSQSVNDYQYIIVPAKFNIFKENDKFRLNTNVKLLLQKYGFKSFLSTDSIPTEIANSNCKKLYADLVKDNSFLSTKIKIVLKDCSEKLIYETAYGKSNEKEFAIAYNQALREAGKSFDKLNYKYNGKNGLAPEIAEGQSNVIKSLQGSESLNIIASNPEAFYFAQPTSNGFQIINNEPKVIMLLFKTSQNNVFIGVKGNKNGVVISKNEQWFFEYYENGKLVSELLKLKF